MSPRERRVVCSSLMPVLYHMLTGAITPVDVPDPRLPVGGRAGGQVGGWVWMLIEGVHADWCLQPGGK